MIDKEIIDNLSHEDTLVLLRTTSSNKIFYNDVCGGRILIQEIRLKLDDDERSFLNRTIYDKSGKTREVPHQIKIMRYSEIGDPMQLTERKEWTWVNSVDNRNWDWFYSTYYLLMNKHYTNKELYVMSEEDTINNYKIFIRDSKLISIGI